MPLWPAPCSHWPPLPPWSPLWPPCSKSGRAESQAGNASLWVYRVACLSMLLYIVASLEGSGRTMLRQVQLGTSEEAAALEMCAAKGWVGPKQLAINQTPFSLPVAEHKFAYQLARMELPTLVSKPRLLVGATHVHASVPITAALLPTTTLPCALTRSGCIPAHYVQLSAQLALTVLIKGVPGVRWLGGWAWSAPG